eukprot:TRINITY_DN1683_c0_g1_i1.p1 TRINITY_DN1683_c0_g1~~TRINITY_DN1683_c0_g1_i1.p1  ORF type:complete len:105 (-),score=11.13 TRINITY_DN1683_c0_g1_i1:168-482(-)
MSDLLLNGIRETWFILRIYQISLHTWNLVYAFFDLSFRFPQKYNKSYSANTTAKKSHTFHKVFNFYKRDSKMVTSMVNYPIHGVLRGFAVDNIIYNRNFDFNER